MGYQESYAATQSKAAQINTKIADYNQQLSLKQSAMESLAKQYETHKGYVQGIFTSAKGKPLTRASNVNIKIKDLPGTANQYNWNKDTYDQLSESAQKDIEAEQAAYDQLWSQYVADVNTYNASQSSKKSSSYSSSTKSVQSGSSKKSNPVYVTTVTKKDGSKVAVFAGRSGSEKTITVPLSSKEMSAALSGPAKNPNTGSTISTGSKNIIQSLAKTDPTNKIFNFDIGIKPQAPPSGKINTSSPITGFATAGKSITAKDIIQRDALFNISKGLKETAEGVSGWIGENAAKVAYDLEKRRLETLTNPVEYAKIKQNTKYDVYGKMAPIETYQTALREHLQQKPEDWGVSGKFYGQQGVYFIPGVGEAKAVTDFIHSKNKSEAIQNALNAATFGVGLKIARVGGGQLANRIENELAQRAIGYGKQATEYGLQAYLLSGIAQTDATIKQLLKEGRTSEAKALVDQMNEETGAAYAGFMGGQHGFTQAGKALGWYRQNVVGEPLQLRERYSIIDQLSQGKPVTVTSTINVASGGKRYVKNPAEIGDTGYADPRLKGFFGAPTHNGSPINVYGELFTTRGREMPVIQAIKNPTSAEVGILKNIRPLELPKQKWAEIKREIETTHGISETNQRLIEREAIAQGMKYNEPIAIPSPKQLKGELQPESEVFVHVPEALQKQKKSILDVISGKSGKSLYKLPNYTYTGAIAKHDIPVFESNLAGNVKKESNLLNNPKAMEHLLDEYATKANLKIWQMTKNAPKALHSYDAEQHGIQHSTNLAKNLVSIRDRKGILDNWTNEEFKLAGIIHDSAKVGAAETAPIKHGPAAAMLIESGKLNLPPKWQKVFDNMSPLKKLQMTEAIRSHTDIRPATLDALLHKDHEQGYATNIKGIIEGTIGGKDVLTMKQALATADRQDLARFGITPKKGLMWDWATNKEALKNELQKTNYSELLKQYAQRPQSSSGYAAGNIPYPKPALASLNYPYSSQGEALYSDGGKYDEISFPGSDKPAPHSDEGGPVPENPEPPPGEGQPDIGEPGDPDEPGYVGAESPEVFEFGPPASENLSATPSYAVTSPPQTRGSIQTRQGDIEGYAIVEYLNRKAYPDNEVFLSETEAVDKGLYDVDQNRTTNFEVVRKVGPLSTKRYVGNPRKFYKAKGRYYEKRRYRTDSDEERKRFGELLRRARNR